MLLRYVHERTVDHASRREARRLPVPRTERAPDRREIWYTDGESGFYVLRVDPRVWPRAAALPGCTEPTVARHVSVRRGRLTTVRVKLTRDGLPVRGGRVNLSGPGFKLHKKAGRGGIAIFKVRAKKSGQAIVSSPLCDGRVRVRVS